MKKPLAEPDLGTSGVPVWVDGRKTGQDQDSQVPKVRQVPKVSTRSMNNLADWRMQTKCKYDLYENMKSQNFDLKSLFFNCLNEKDFE